MGLLEIEVEKKEILSKIPTVNRKEMIQVIMSPAVRAITE